MIESGFGANRSILLVLQLSLRKMYLILERFSRPLRVPPPAGGVIAGVLITALLETLHTEHANYSFSLIYGIFGQPSVISYQTFLTTDINFTAY